MSNGGDEGGQRPAVNASMLCAREGEGANGRGLLGRGRTSALAHERRRSRVGTSGQRERAGVGMGQRARRGMGRRWAVGEGGATRGEGVVGQGRPSRGEGFFFFLFQFFSISLYIYIYIYTNLLRT
jgi:hypothetical protein